MTTKKLNRKFFWSVLLITLLAFALRVFRLDAQSLWWDEVFGVAVSRQGFPQFLDVVLEDRVHPPGFSFLMVGWSVLGIEEFVARYFALVLGVATMPLIYRLGKQVGGAAVGLIAAGLLAFSPFHLWYSQEARMYAPLAFVATASGLLFMKLLHQPRARDTLLYAIVSVVGLYLHTLFPLSLMAQLVFLVLKRRSYPRALAPWLGANLVAGGLYLPWLAAIFLTGGYANARISWIPAAQWYEPLLSFYSFYLGSTNDPNLWWTWITPIVLGALALFAVIRASNRLERDTAHFLSVWILLPILFLYLVSLPLPLAQKRAIYLDRFLIQVVPALLVLSAWGIVRLAHISRRATFALMGLAAIAIAFSLWNNFMTPEYFRDDWRIVDQVAQTRANPRTHLVLDATMILPYAYYDRAHLPHNILPDPFPPAPEAWVQDVRAQGAEQFWLVTATIPPNAHRFVPNAAQQQRNAKRDPAKQWFDAHLPIQEQRALQGLYLTLYRLTP